MTTHYINTRTNQHRRSKNTFLRNFSGVVPLIIRCIIYFHTSICSVICFTTENEYGMLPLKKNDSTHKKKRFFIYDNCGMAISSSAHISDSNSRIGTDYVFFDTSGHSVFLFKLTTHV